MYFHAMFPLIAGGLAPTIYPEPMLKHDYWSSTRNFLFNKKRGKKLRRRQ